MLAFFAHTLALKKWSRALVTSSLLPVKVEFKAKKSPKKEHGHDRFKLSTRVSLTCSIVSHHSD